MHHRVLSPTLLGMYILELIPKSGDVPTNPSLWAGQIIK